MGILDAAHLWEKERGLPFGSRVSQESRGAQACARVRSAVTQQATSTSYSSCSFGSRTKAMNKSRLTRSASEGFLITFSSSLPCAVATCPERQDRAAGERVRLAQAHAHANGDTHTHKHTDPTREGICSPAARRAAQWCAPRRTPPLCRSRQSQSPARHIHTHACVRVCASVCLGLWRLARTRPMGVTALDPCAGTRVG
jgi:hypothetical protein